MKDEGRIYTLLYLIFLTVCFLFFSYFIFYSDILNLITVVPDDSSYYLKIADNYSKGFGFTFDRFHRTNGFQPLWQILIISVFAIFKTSPENSLRIILFLQLMLITFSALIFFRITSIFFEKVIAVLSGVFFMSFVFFQSINGMETPLLIFFISILFYSGIRMNIFSEHNVKNELLWGILLGLLILSRLDSAFYAVSIFIFSAYSIFFISKNMRDDFIRLLCIVIGSGLVVAPYLLCNLINFDNIIPISGVLKSGFDVNIFDGKIQEIMMYRETYFAISGIIYLVWFIGNLKKIRENKNFFFRLSLAVFSAGVILSLSYLIFFVNWGVFYWYFIPFSVFFSLLICIPADYYLLFKGDSVRKKIIIVFICLVAFYWGHKNYIKYIYMSENSAGNWNVESYNAAQWVKANTDMSENMAMKDAGHFSFFSERNVVNLDGLVNDFQFQEILQNKQLNNYLKDNNVKYLVQHAVWNRPDVVEGNYDFLILEYVSHKYNSESDAVIVKKENEVYRSAPYYDGKHKAVFIIWKLNA